MTNTTQRQAYVAPYASVLEFEMEQKVIMSSGTLHDMNGNPVYDEGF